MHCSKGAWLCERNRISTTHTHHKLTHANSKASRQYLIIDCTSPHNASALALAPPTPPTNQSDIPARHPNSYMLHHRLQHVTRNNKSSARESCAELPTSTRTSFFKVYCSNTKTQKTSVTTTFLRWYNRDNEYIFFNFSARKPPPPCNKHVSVSSSLRPEEALNRVAGCGKTFHRPSA